MTRIDTGCLGEAFAFIARLCYRCRAESRRRLVGRPYPCLAAHRMIGARFPPTERPPAWCVSADKRAGDAGESRGASGSRGPMARTLLNSTDLFYREFRDLPFHVATLRYAATRVFTADAEGRGSASRCAVLTRETSVTPR